MSETDSTAGVNGKNSLQRSFPAGEQTGDEFIGQMGTGVAAAKGSSCDTDLQDAYPSSPIHAGTLTINAIKTTFQQTLDGTQTWAADFLTSGGSVGVNMDYSGAPDLSSVAVSNGGGEPSTAWSPNLNSPGNTVGAAVNLDPTKVEPMSDPPTGHLGDLGLVESPSEASGKSSYTIGQAYEKGRSPHYYNSTPAEGDEG